jgi:hypothetical protein
MKSVSDSSFKYRPSFETDVRKTFQRVRRREGREPDRLVVTPSQCATQIAVLPLEHFKRPRAD